MKQNNEKNKETLTFYTRSVYLYTSRLLNFMYAIIVKLIEYIGLAYENISRLFICYNHEMLSVLITL